MSKRKRKHPAKTGLRKAQLKAGLPPGTLIHVGEKYTDKSRVELITYNSEGFRREEYEDTSKVFREIRKNELAWINIDGLHNIPLIETVGQEYNLHPLLLEDVLNTEQRPKSEEYKDHLFFTLKTLNEIEGDEINYEQISFVLGHNYLLSFQEKEGDLFGQLRDRMKLPDSKLRLKGIDYLFYRLIDTIIDGYYIVLEHVGERLENMEEKVYQDPSQEMHLEIQDMKKELIYLRKTVYPLREAIKMTMTEPKFISDDTRRYFTDVYDHTVQVIETIESYRDMAASLIDTYMTSINNKMNEVMQVLTIIATIFIPLTFVVGVYGMNFENMPELSWKYGYPAVWVIMILLTLGMIIYFRKKRWL